MIYFSRSITKSTKEISEFLYSESSKTLRHFFHKRKESTQFFHAQEKKRTLGLVGVSTLAFLGVRVLYLKYLAVDKKTQGQGVGTEILEKLEDKAKQDKYDFIFLTSSIKRKQAHRFYKKNGFYKIFGALFLKKL